MALIKLTGKYAVGQSEFAIVDDDMVDFLSQWRWKAKPNGGRNNVYAVRNTVIDGKSVTLRMHRIVAAMGRDNPLEVDHDNHNSLDNRRANLVPATRSQNMLNSTPFEQVGNCKHCGISMRRMTTICARASEMACKPCKSKRHAALRSSAVFFTKCKHCQRAITARRPGREFCTDMCRCRHRAAMGYVSPSRRRQSLSDGPA
ncbi:HNH endonuclease [Paraburkholderia sp. WP4_3_2]|uniref:HNH endonuclease n=1 Tax=Paraburkholderia sp. WP4_3_2 TaxID=2587162 RepID=UPI0016124DED|nr:HNH endonuclease [Paraburkholderia sp. WP4_3_2]MBB3256876.1 hypothetical protein [Paraburkholderia sp. WP4_3_2]